MPSPAATRSRPRPLRDAARRRRPRRPRRRPPRPPRGLRPRGLRPSPPRRAARRDRRRRGPARPRPHADRPPPRRRRRPTHLRFEIAAAPIDPAIFFPARGDGADVRTVRHPDWAGAHKWADRDWLEAREAELGEVVPLILGTDDEVLEAGRANLFLVTDGALATPPVDGRILPGTARAATLELAAELGIPATERPLHLADLEAADDLFLTSSLRGIRPVRIARRRPLEADRPPRRAPRDGAPRPLARRAKPEKKERASRPALRHCGCRRATSPGAARARRAGRSPRPGACRRTWRGAPSPAAAPAVEVLVDGEQLARAPRRRCSRPSVLRSSGVGSRPIAVSTASPSPAQRRKTHSSTRLFSPNPGQRNLPSSSLRNQLT